MESKALLAAFRIPIAQTVVARSPSEAMVLAEEIGLPVVMKIDSPQITHKSDSGGVRLNLNSLAAVRDSYNEIVEEVRKNRPDAIIHGVAIEPMIQKANGRELMVGMTRDQVFGPTILFGPGGVGVEATGKDRAVALPPLNQFLVADMLASTHTSAKLGAFRNMPPVSMDALESVLLRVSEMVCELPWISRTRHQSADRRRERRRRRRRQHLDRATCRSPRRATITWRSTPIRRIWPSATRPTTGRPSTSARSSRKTPTWSRSSSRRLSPGDQVLPLHEHHPRTVASRN